MKQILCLSTTPWRSIPSRTQQLMTRMKGVQVLFFEPAADRKDRSWREGGRRVRPGVTVYTLPPVPTLDERLRPLFHMGQRKLARFINRQLDKHRFRNFLLWTTSPAHVHLLDLLPYEALIYDCDREWTELPELWEGTLARMADVVFAASHDLLDELSPCSTNIALLPNGVHYSLFSHGSNNADRLLPQVSGPILCWTGTLHADLDLSPVIYAATEHPEWTFLLVGQADAENPFLPRLERLPNVVLTGQRPLVELPDYLARSQVCINLLRRETPYSDIVPSRIYEYLSTGNPIVSMLWPDQVEQFPDVIYGAYTQQSFVQLCEQAMNEDRSWVADRRRKYGAEAAWSRRAEDVMRILDTVALL